MKVNREIRASKVRLISAAGEQVGVVAIHEAMAMAEQAGLDLVEIVATSAPPVCKIMNYGKFRYDQTKREKEGKKTQHQVKVKEIKLKPNIDQHDLEVKLRRAREFILKGNKVKVTLIYRGREMMHQELGARLLQEVCQLLEDVATAEVPPKLFGRILSVVLAPGSKKSALRSAK